MTAQIFVVLSKGLIGENVSKKKLNFSHVFLFFLLENGFNSDKHKKMQSMKINKQKY